MKNLQWIFLEKFLCNSKQLIIDTTFSYNGDFIYLLAPSTNKSGEFHTYIISD